MADGEFAAIGAKGENEVADFPHYGDGQSTGYVAKESDQQMEHGREKPVSEVFTGGTYCHCEYWRIAVVASANVVENGR